MARTSGRLRAKRKRKMSFVRGVTSESEGSSTKNHRVDSWVGVEFQGVFDIQNEPTCLVQKIEIPISVEGKTHFWGWVQTAVTFRVFGAQQSFWYLATRAPQVRTQISVTVQVDR